VPGLYLLVIVVSFAGVCLLAHRLLPGVVSPRLLRPIAAVLMAFLAFDAIGAARGWFASNLDWVTAYLPPGIPPEEPLLLAFLALFSVVLFEAFRRGWPGRRHQETRDRA
jgi:xanthine/uracil permease